MFGTIKSKCRMDGWDGMGYLQTGSFLDHLSVIITSFKVMRAAAASIQVLRPGGHWRIAVPDAYFPKYVVLSS